MLGFDETDCDMVPALTAILLKGLMHFMAEIVFASL